MKWILKFEVTCNRVCNQPEEIGLPAVSGLYQKLMSP